MGRARSFVIAGVSAVALLLVSSAGAVAPNTNQAHRIDLSSTSKIHAYLRSIGLNPRSVVIQRGKKNYAGPNCPGKDWNCTKGTTRVLQIGTQNSADCVNGVGACVGVIQTEARNTYRCVWRTSANPAMQHCSVKQTGERNYALFELVATQSSSSATAQDATQIVEVHQSASGPTPKNELHVFQRVKQSLTTSGTQSQDAHQVVRPFPATLRIQEASAGGDNFAQLHEYIDQRESGAASTQEQNPAPPTPPFPPTPVVPDCHPGGLGPDLPNQCVNAEQVTGSGGKNNVQLHQLIDEDARSTQSGAIQTQGNEFGGIDGRIHQEVGGIVGSSNAQDHQAMRQNVVGAEGSVQVQIDPTRCCGVSQTGGVNNLMKSHQGGSQKSNGDLSEQQLMLIGECYTVNGSCFVTHQARNDEDHDSYHCGSAGDPCPPESVTECQSTEFQGEGTGRCDTPDDFVDLTAVGIFTESTFLPGTPLSGYEVTMGLVAPDLSFFP